MKRLAQPVKEFNMKWSNTSFERRRLLTEKFQNQDDIPKKLANEEMIIYQQQLYTIIQERLSKGEAESFVTLIKNYEIVSKHVNQYENEYSIARDIYISKLKEDHYILSKSYEWVGNCEEEFRKKWNSQNSVEGLFEKIGVDMIKDSQEKYIFQYNQTIYNSPDFKSTKKELEETLVPAKVYHFDYNIWNPKNWVITKTKDMYNRYSGSMYLKSN
jgi:hypothetical protein